MQDGVVDAAAAEGDILGEQPLRLPVSGEEIEGQRLFPALDELGCLVQALIGQHRQQGPEDFLLHDGVPGLNVIQQGGGNPQGVRLGLAAADHLGRVNQTAEAVKVLAVDDLAVVGVGEGVGAVLPGNLLLNQGQKRLLHALVHQQIVGGNAGLAAVEELAKDNPPGRHLQIAVGGDDAGALASQLQGDRGQVDGGLFHHQPPHRDPAGEEDIVEPLLQKGCVFGTASLHNGDVFEREYLAEDGVNHRRGGGGIGRGLDDAAVARRDGPDHRLHAEHEGIVPGGHHQNNAVRLKDRPGAGGEVGQIAHPAAGPGPAAQVTDLVAQLRQGHAGLAHIAFGGGFAQVFFEGGVDFLLVGQNGLPQAAQPLQTGVDVEGLAGIKELPLHAEDRFDVHVGFLSRRQSCRR